MLTEILKGTLALVDVRVLDHFVVGDSAAVSSAERGLILGGFFKPSPVEAAFRTSCDS